MGLLFAIQIEIISKPTVLPRHPGIQKLAESCAGFLIQRMGHHTLVVQGHSANFHFSAEIRNTVVF